jgi:Glycosyl transferase family 2
VSEQARVCLVSASRQNAFFAEILEAYGEALAAAGIGVEHSVDCFPPLSAGLVYLYVPHEFHSLVDELSHPTPAQRRHAIALCTEQPGTPWFEISCEIAGLAGAAFDLNRLGAEEMRRRGIAAEYAPLGYVSSWDRWRGVERERSVEMAFLGGYTERRAQALARCSPALVGRRAAIYLTETGVPHVAGSPYFLSHDRKWELMADTRVLLNVHRGELPYMEWHRVIGAILNGCVVLSEQPLGAEPLCPGEHFVSARFDDLPLVLEGLLEDPGRLRRIRDAAYEQVRETMPMSATAAGILDQVERLARVAPAPGAPSAPPVPLPRALPAPVPDWEAHATNLGARELPVRMALKHLVVGMRRLERRVGELGSQGAPAADHVERLGPRGGQPDLSVLLTIHNYADYVGQALRSVAVAELPGVEVVAVDDASSDDSVAAIRAAAEELPWLPVTLVRRERNQGLPAARNLALEHARADLVFILDADNLVLRQGLHRLYEALQEYPEAAFAYGLIECFDSGGPCDVLNWIDWDPTRLRHGNYIDAMAMIRRSALDRIGGYPLDSELFGWEDFAVWIAIASAGMHGVRVPSFVARYRQSSHSMLSLTGIDTSAAWATLLRRFPGLGRPGGFGKVLDAETEPVAG